MLRQFNNLLGITPDENAGEQEFIFKATAIVNNLIPLTSRMEFFEGIFFELGLDYITYKYLGLSEYVKDNFINSMKLVAALYSFSQKGGYFDIISALNRLMPEIISGTSTKLGVRWKDGFFYPDRIHEVDNIVIDETLSWLSKIPAAKKDLHNALINYSQDRIEQVTPLCYTALENVIQHTTGLTSSLHKSKLHEELLKKIKVSENWKALLANFTKYSNDYGRHGANPNRHNVDPDEIESYLYLTFIMVRMIIKKVPG